MLMTFKSRAAAEILMYKEHAQRILELLGKDVDQGVITVAELPTAIARLEKEIEASRAEARAHQAEEEASRDKFDKDEDEAAPLQSVSFASRAYPLLEMLRAAQKEQLPVMWGV
jgi:septal ring factor EnvC (AmiA/AmiB activator)